MLSQFFEAPERIRAIRSDPSGALIEAFAEQLFERGYANISARRHIRAAEHLMLWAGRRGLTDHDLNDGVLKRFGEHLSRCRCGCYSCAKHVDVLNGARLFLRHLQGVAEPAVHEGPPIPAEPQLLKEFEAWMREHRGTSDRGLYNYSLPLRELLKDIGENPQKLDARCLRREFRRCRKSWVTVETHSQLTTRIN